MTRVNMGRQRDRVTGNGPDRKELPNFKTIAKMPQEVIDELLQSYEDNPNNNDVFRTEYVVRNICAMTEHPPKAFFSMFYQELDPSTDDTSFIETRYKLWNDVLGPESATVKWMNETFPNAFRSRLSVLQPGTGFDWHIDTNTSVACRVTCVLRNPDSKFEINRRGEIETMQAEVGDCIFTNTGWTHRVYNDTNESRINFLFSIEYKDIEKYF